MALKKSEVLGWVCFLAIATLLSSYGVGYGQFAPLRDLPERRSFTTADTAYVRELMDRSDKLLDIRPDSVFLLLEEARRRSVAINYTDGAINAMLKTAFAYVLQGEHHTARIILRNVHALLARTPASRLRIYWNKTQGNLFALEGKNDSALIHFEQGMQIARELKDTGNMIMLNLDMAAMWMGNREFNNALERLRNAEKLARQSKYDPAAIYINYAMVYSKKNDTAGLYRYALKIKELASASGNTRAYRQALLVLSVHAQLSGDYRAALRYGLDALALSDPDNASSRSDAEFAISVCYYNLDNYQKAKEHGLNALAGYAGTDSYTQPMAGLYRHLAVVHYRLGQFKMAFEYQNTYSRISDSLNDISRNRSVDKLENRYRIAEKDKELAWQQLELTKKENRLKTSRILFISGITISSLLLISLVLLQRNARNKQKQMQQEAAIKELEASMQSEQKERNRIAMELHDGIVSNLTAIKLNLDITRPEAAYSKVYQDMLAQLEDAILDVRNTAHNLMPEILVRHHPDKAIALLCGLIEKTGKLEVQFLSYGDLSEIDPETGLNLYRMVQELLHNIIKHAGATRALVQLSCYDRLLSVTVEDNGIHMLKPDKGMGTGMKNIVKRVAEMNGSLKWGASGFGSGMGVHIELELNR